MMRWLDRLDWLGERTRPHYGQVVLWTLLVCAWPLSIYFVRHRPEPPGPGQRVGPATVFSWLPESVLQDGRWSYVAWGCFAAGSLLWAVQRGLPWAGWLTAFSFTAVVGLYLENANQCTHVAHLTAMLLILYALWYHVCRQEIQQALAERRFWRTPLYPRWVYSASVFYVGLFYGFSGLGKWQHSGLDWPNGTSLQLWTFLFGDGQSIWSKLILSDRRLAEAMQWATLLGETGGFLAIVSAQLRPVIGLALIGFHLAAIAVFGWGFHANAAVLTLVFLPFYTLVPCWVERWEGGVEQGREAHPPEGLS